MRKACPDTKVGLVRLILLSLQSGCVRLFGGTLINSFHEANQYKGLGVCVGGRGAKLHFSDSSYQNYQQAVLWRPPALCAICLSKSSRAGGF